MVIRWKLRILIFSPKQSKAEEFLSFYYTAVDDDSTILSGLTPDCPFESAAVIDRGRIYVAGSLSTSFVLLIVGYSN